MPTQSKWRKGPPTEVAEPEFILAGIGHDDGFRYYVCTIASNNDLLAPGRFFIGRLADDIERWIPLSDVVRILDGESHD